MNINESNIFSSNDFIDIEVIYLEQTNKQKTITKLINKKKLYKTR